MNIIFVTRCYKPTNLQILKDNLKEVFQKQTEHTYVQYLLVDMSYGQKEQAFYPFEDEHTKVVITYNKIDYYNSSNIDSLTNRLKSDQNSWVYCLDDDNLINDNFLTIFNNLQDEEVLVVNNNYLKFNSPLQVGKIIGKIDLCNYVVKLNVKKKVDFYDQDKLSYECDGRFFEKLVTQQYKIKYTNICVVKKGALKRPLNVLRKDV